MRMGNSKSPAARRLEPLPGVAAVMFAALFFLAGTYFGSTRDFGAFLFSIPILPLTFIGALIPATWAASLRAQRQYGAVAFALIGLAAPSYVLSYSLAQRVRFILWAPTHVQQLVQASRKNGVIMGWDAWGMAGEDTYSYLVVDTQDRLGSKARAEQWTKEIGQTCGLWQTQKMWPKIYLATTYTNCPYDGVAPAN